MSYTRRLATKDDFEQIMEIAKSPFLGFVREVTMNRAIELGDISVAVDHRDSTCVLGYMYSRRKKDGWGVVSEIAVRKEFRHQGIGQLMLRSLPAPVQAKVMITNHISNRLFESCGYEIAYVERGKKTPMIVWQLLP
jgi:ribosomal protein S18 acetylase RimI-like enzyme